MERCEWEQKMFRSLYRIPILHRYHHKQIKIYPVLRYEDCLGLSNTLLDESVLKGLLIANLQLANLMQRVRLYRLLLSLIIGQ